MTRVVSKSGRFIALLPDDMRGAFAVVATSDGVGSFAARWPCNHIPERRWEFGGYCPIRFEFEGNGDLVDIEPQLGGGDDGPAILALSQDAQEFGEKCMERRRAKLAGTPEVSA